LQKIVRIAVRSLVEYVFRSGDLGGDFLGANRAVEGIQAHRKIQHARPAEYRKEIPVSYQFLTEHFILEISGRIDGVYTYADQVIVEEIKTITGDLRAFAEIENPLHWGQVKSYAYLYTIAHNLTELDAQLTYYQLDTREIRECRRHFTCDELAHFFQELVASYLVRAETIERWYLLRNASIQNLEFPFTAYRPGQRQMAVATYLTIKQGEQLLAQAPTGIGKTMAVLFAALKALAEGHTTKIFYLTARTTGSIAAAKALEVMRSQGLRIKSLALTAKEKICFQPECDCTPEQCEFARGYFDRINQAVQAAFEQDAFTREFIEAFARKYRVCPFEYSLDLSLWTDCIVCDYNYAFDPRASLKRFFLEPRGEYTFLIDEAHNLVDRAREMFSAEIRKQPLLELRQAVKPTLPELYKLLGKINTWLLKARKQCEEQDNPRSEKSCPADLLPLFRECVAFAERWLVSKMNAAFRAELLEAYFDVSRFITVAEQHDERYATCFEKLDRDLRLKLFCIDPASRLEDALQRCKAAVFFSATLTPTDYFKAVFGCKESAASLILPSPFPREHLCLLVVNSISTLYRRREQTAAAITQMLVATVTQRKGNYLLFFPSYQYLRAIYTTFAEQCLEIETIVQTAGMTETEREAFLAKFTCENQKTLVGFAVMGGIFGEGIDLVGDRLTGAIIVGVGLPGICLERDLIRDYFVNVRGTGFDYAYRYPGFNRVLQAAGRVIRSEQDRGVVVLIDERFATARYTSLFPVEWQPVRVNNSIQLRKILNNFWNPEIP
jgi:DNA excision repair protein ERCC-2